MLGSRQTRPSDPTAWTLFVLRVLSAGMVPSPKPMPCLLMHAPSSMRGHDRDGGPGPIVSRYARAVGDSPPAVRHFGASPCVLIEHTLKYLIVLSTTYSVLKRGDFTQHIDTLSALHR